MSIETDTPYVHLELSDEILIATYKKGLQIDLEMAREIVRSRVDFTEGRELPVLILNEGVLTINKEAREYFASSEGTYGLSAAALILNSAFEFMLGFFFMNVNVAEIQSRIFKHEDKAVKWLKNFSRDGR
jgi:hypothetical protein